MKKECSMPFASEELGEVPPNPLASRRPLGGDTQIVKRFGYITCTRRIEFDAAHRVVGHEGKCRHVHGHRYALEATFAARQLDALGRVVDFGAVKERLGGWIDAHWDHAAILFTEDKTLGEAISNVTGQAIFYLPANPTAENMAEYIFTKICPELFAGLPIECVRVRLYETPNCYADASSS